jgi:Ser/Thr protein kinase RdoA (MazF antagonist)
VAPRLAQLHGLLRGYSGPSVPLDAAFDDLDRLVALLGEAPVPSPADVDLLGSEMARARAGLAAARTDHPQALHGDPHAGNMLVTPGGTVWADFEETCVGPVEWDLACLTYRHSDPGHLVDRYVEAGRHRMRDKVHARGDTARQTNCNVDALLPFIGARWVEAVAWTSYLAIHRPDRRKDAEGFAREWLDWLRRRGG